MFINNFKILKIEFNQKYLKHLNTGLLKTISILYKDLFHKHLKIEKRILEFLMLVEVITEIKENKKYKL